MRIAIHGVGVLGGFGCGMDRLETVLTSKASPPESVRIVSGGKTVTIPVYRTDTTPLEKFIAPVRLRRIDHFSRMALLGAFLAIEDAGLPHEIPGDRTGIVLCSGYGATRTTFNFLDTVMDDGDMLASPTHFANSVHNAAAAHIAMMINVRGPNLTISQFEFSVHEGLMAACRMLEENRVEYVLCGGVDECCDVLHYCRTRFGCTDHNSPVGEGAAFFLLSNGIGGNPPPYGWFSKVVMESAETAVIQQRTYRHLYGELPVGPGFDLAVSALSIKNNRLYPAQKTKEPPVHGVTFQKENGKLQKAMVTIQSDQHRRGIIQLEARAA